MSNREMDLPDQYVSTGYITKKGKLKEHTHTQTHTEADTEARSNTSTGVSWLWRGGRVISLALNHLLNIGAGGDR